jgi:exosortase A
MSAILAASRPHSMTRTLVIGLALLIPLLVYFPTAHSIVAIWNRSETFAHGYIILPISLWLIWQRRRTLENMTVAPFWPAFVLLAACGFGWLLADLGDVQIVRQYAFVAMLPLTALAILGQRIARTIAFALVFILFAVPFGEIFIDPLIGVTANFTVDALRWTGIPVLREGNSFTIPSGNWSVVEACSGVRYLISSFTLGCLYAYLTYRSRWRQALFVLLSALVPIAANGARAYMIVMMGHLSGMTMAVGVDHLIYGWVFFGIVMFLLFWIGSFWREDHKPGRAQIAPLQPPAEPAPVSTARLCAAALGVAACIGIWPAYALYLQRAEFNPAPAQLTAVNANWPARAAFADWAPAFSPPNAELQRFYEKDGRRVGLSVLYYRNQNAGSQLISSTNRLAAGHDGGWRQFDSALRTEPVGGDTLRLREGMLSGATGRMLVWHWYWIDGQRTSSDYVGKALQVRQKFFHGSDDGAAVMLFAPYDENPDEARAALRAFLRDNLGAVDAVLAANRKR